MKRQKWKLTIAVMVLMIIAVFCGCSPNSAEKVAVESCSTTLEMDIDGY